VSAAQVEESISVKNGVHDAAEDDIEPPDVALEVESDSVNTDTEQDKQRAHEVVDINASVGGHSDTTTAQGPTPYHGTRCTHDSCTITVPV
jgi:hypothetical protein